MPLKCQIICIKNWTHLQLSSDLVHPPHKTQFRPNVPSVRRPLSLVSSHALSDDAKDLMWSPSVELLGYILYKQLAHRQSEISAKLSSVVFVDSGKEFLRQNILTFIIDLKD